ncbi:sugar ABC transporter permease [Paenibacillus baekrokdamisoli]|uniref:Sugar ABC transporter permease n=1 Tax=Paenibacillus baekrokdamisoli TaxID=1712516 RepID=A0A3G9IZ97_9BACL|nr:carbohydrate ABC transporter permease [Paenibacillus baekrokdamisoli]MBB3068770.1 multiple sugar transport system permease protein [Paenibacillus baekrokdamisoli]BBH23602.1 sugar ABC transporter permease [Paenibacillus baekrokdamisoli]
MKQKQIRTLLLTIFLTVIALVMLFPVVLTIVSSLMTEKEIMLNYGMLGSTQINDFANLKLIPDWVSFEQFFKVLISTSQFLRMFWNSVFMVVPIIIGQVVVATLAAFAFAKLRFPGREPLFIVYLITMLMPFQVTLVPNYIMSDRLGLINSPSSIILPGIFAAFGVFLLRQFMLQIPTAYMEAAKMDGAGYFRSFVTMVLPMVKPGMAALVVLLFADYWNMVEQPLIFLQDAALQPLSIFLSRLQEDAFGVSFAAAVLYMMPMILLFLLAERYFIEGIELSGIKG